MGTFLRFYDGAFACLLIRIKLAPDPPFPDRGLIDTITAPCGVVIARRGYKVAERHGSQSREPIE
jgi:hypothetical protein